MSCRTRMEVIAVRDGGSESRSVRSGRDFDVTSYPIVQIEVRRLAANAAWKLGRGEKARAVKGRAGEAFVGRRPRQPDENGPHGTYIVSDTLRMANPRR